MNLANLAIAEKIDSCRTILEGLELEKAENASLIMARYVKKIGNAPEARENLFASMKVAALNARDLYAQAFNKRQKFLSGIASSKCFETLENAALAAGLGGSNVLETGLALNPTYGIPMIPASSIKGVTAHYCSEMLGAGDERYKGPNYNSDDKSVKSAGEIYELLFGKIYPEEKQESGILRFYDAWLFPDCVKDAFVDDVMTPHHSDYYSGKAERPTDFDDPNPISFLTVRGKFEFWIGCECNDKNWTEFAFKIVEAALQSYGIGGKINSGYGKMKRVMSPEEKEEYRRQLEHEQDRKLGFTHSKGEVISVKCTRVQERRGKIKRDFAFAEPGASDKMAVRFQVVPQVNQGDVFNAEIIDLVKANKAYMLKQL